MPTINKKPVLLISTQKENQRKRHKLYNTAQWRTLRRIYMQSHPLCEECLKNDIINGDNIHVHHILSPFDSNISEMEQYRRMYDYGNLRCLCSSCHAKEHNEEKKSQKDNKS